MSAAPDGRIAVVGGGVIGCEVAAELAPDHDVVLFEADRIAGGATGRSAGLVTVEPAFSDALSVADRAMAGFDTLDEAGHVTFHRTPSLEPVPGDEADLARRRLDRLQEAAVSVEWLDPETVEAHHPLSFDGYAGALRFERAGWVDSHALTDAYRRTAEEAGATLDVGTAVQDVVVADGTVVAVETDDGTRRCDGVVVAAGWATPQLVTPLVDLPVRPYRTQCVRIKGLAEVENCPMAWVPTRDCYFRPDLDGLLVGGLPSFVDDPAAASRAEDAAFRRHVAAVLEEVIAVEGPLRLADGWAGVDLATPDGRPIVDAPAEAPAGLVVATGFHGRGIMTAPVVGAIVRERLGDRSTDLPTAPFRADRFGSVPDEFAVPGIGDG
ncbi:MAG: sarcosine oxidase subunit beta [Halobacteriales archaeon]|jgi:sarcosine oxidase subunit beta